MKILDVALKMKNMKVYNKQTFFSLYMLTFHNSKAIKKIYEIQCINNIMVESKALINNLRS